MNDKTQQQQQQNTTNKCGDNVCENQIDRITTRNSIDTEINNPFVKPKFFFYYKHLKKLCLFERTFDNFCKLKTV